MDDIFENEHLVNLESEQYIIGGLLKDSKRVLKLCNHFNVESNWFTLPVAWAAIKAIETLVEHNQIIEAVSVLEIIRTQGLTPNVTLMDLHHCETTCRDTQSCLQHINIVGGKYKKRQLLLEMEDIKQRIYSDENITDVIGTTKSMLEALGKNRQSASTIRDIAQNISDKFTKAKEHGCAGYPSRFITLQGVLGGYNAGGVCIISALPKEGKTTLLLNEQYTMAKNGISSGIISLEMSEEDVRTKMACDELGFDRFTLQLGKATKAEIFMIKEAIEKQEDLPLRIIDKSKTINEITGIMRDYQDDWKVCGIDYVQKIAVCGTDPKNIVERIGGWSTSIANTTGDTQLATLLLSQMSREAACDFKGNRREPEPRFLKGSGTLEQDLSQLVFVYQELRYKNETITDNVDTKFKVAMNRTGQIGKIDMCFQKSKQRFIVRGTEERNNLGGPAF